MQQEAEFTLLAEKLRKYGADDEIMLHAEDDYRLSLNPENTQQHSGTMERKSQNNSDRVSAMRSGAQVRSTLMKMSQGN